MTEDIYIDQAPHRSKLLDRTFSSTYTTTGIRSIDSNFCIRIININLKIKQVFQIKRIPEKYYHYKTGKECDGLSKVDYYKEIDPYDLRIGFGIRVVWENNTKRDFYHGGNDVLPNVNFITKKDNPQTLWMQIENNIHLHDKIKENLLDNLKNTYKNYNI